MALKKRVLKDWIGSYLKYVENTEPAEMYHIWTAMSVIASCLERKCSMDMGFETIYPNLYVVLVGAAGKCRKGTAMNIGRSFLEKQNVHLAPSSLTRQGLISTLVECTTTDTTSKSFSSHSSLTIYSEEFTVFIGYKNPELIMDLTDLYDCKNKWVYRTVIRGNEVVNNVYLNMLGATTPSLIQDTLNANAVGGGLSSRIVFVFATDAKQRVPFHVKTDQEVELEKKLHEDLTTIKGLQGKFRYTQDFIDAYSKWYKSNRTRLYGKYWDGYNSRRGTHLRKMCMVLSASKDNDMTIDKETFDTALRILLETESTMHMTFGGVGANPLAPIMQDMMSYLISRESEQKQKPITYSELKKEFRNEVSETGFDEIMRTFIHINFIQQVDQSTIKVKKELLNEQRKS